MGYRIAQIQKPYLAPVSYGGPATTTPCYMVESTEYESPEKAREEIKSRSDGKYPHAYAAPEDWFIIIQTF